MLNRLNSLIFITFFCTVITGCTIRYVPKVLGSDITSAEPDDVYKDFMTGKHEVLFLEEHDYGEYIRLSEVLENNSRYTYDELYTSIDGQFKIMNSVYNYIDCGLDGVPELLLSINIDNGLVDDFWIKMVIKNTENGLVICYAADQWSRCETIIKYSGFVSSGGSEGAEVHGGYFGYIDKNGCFRIWYDEKNEWYIRTDAEEWLIYRSRTIYEAEEIILEGVDSMYLEKFACGDFLSTGEIYAYFSLYDSKGDRIEVDKAYEDVGYSTLEEILKNEGYNVITEEEASGMKEEYRNRIGLSDEIYYYNDSIVLYK